MSLGAKLLIMVGCVVPLMVIGALVGVFALKAPSGELWEKVPELHTILRAGTGAILGGSLVFIFDIGITFCIAESTSLSPFDNSL